MGDTPVVERAEALLWEAIRQLGDPANQYKAAAATAAVEALRLYRAAVEAQAAARPTLDPDAQRALHGAYR